MENHKCFNEVLENVSEKIKQNIPVNAIEYEAGWKGSIFRFDGGCGIGLRIYHEYRNCKKDGTPFKNKTKEDHFIALSYCPFCGESLKDTKCKD